MTKTRNGMAAIRNGPTMVTLFVNPRLGGANLAYRGHRRFPDQPAARRKHLPLNAAFQPLRRLIAAMMMLKAAYRRL